MKKIISLSMALAALAFGTGALAAPFGSTNLVIYRIGGDANGNTAGVLTNRGNFVWLDEYYTNGTFRQSHMLRTNYFGANSPLIGSGTAFGSGLITRSADGRFIIVNGYGAFTNGFSSGSIQGTFATEVPRVTGLVDGDGNIDTTTVQTNFLADKEEERSGASTDGTNIWFSGSGESGGGIRYTKWGGLQGLATNLNGTVSNIRQLNIYSNQLYFSTVANDARIMLCTNNTPGTIPVTTNNVLETGLRGATNNAPWAFLLFKLKPGGGDDPDTMYVADGSNGVFKSSLVSGTWIPNGSIPAFHAVGLVGQKRVVGSVTNVDLWITGGGGTLSGFDNLLAATDATGYNGTPTVSGDDTVLATSSGTVSFRGIAFAPVGNGGFSGVGAQKLSVGPLLDVFHNGSTKCTPATTNIYSVANLGGTTIGTYLVTSSDGWVIPSPGVGNLTPGQSVNTSITFGDVSGLPSGTNTATISFSNLDNGVGDQTRQVTLIMKDQNLSPSTDFNSSGQSNGPFSPLTKVYTVFNGNVNANNPITLIVTNTYTPAVTNWLSFSATNITLNPCTSTNITVSINTNAANRLAVGNYLSLLTFSNATAQTVIDTVNAQLSVGGLFFCDDFSTYAQNANLVPQQGWTAIGGTVNEPYVTNNAVHVAAYATQDTGDEPYKNFPQITATNNPNNSVYCAMVMTVSTAADVGVLSPSRILTFFQNQGAGGFARDQLTVRDTGGHTQFVFAVRINGIGANPYAFGTNALNYNTPYRVILQGRADNTNTYVYVNPTSPTLDTSTAYVKTNVAGSNAADFNIGCVQFGNTFPSGSFNFQAGIAVSKLCITTNANDAYNDVPAPSADPFATWQLFYFGCTGCSQAQGGADPDGDGMSNTNEFLAGFNPTNNAAYLHIISIARTDGTNVTIRYLGAAGDSTFSPGPKINVLESTTGTPPSFQNNFVSTGLTNSLNNGTGLGQQATFVHTNGATGPARYYRVRVVLP